MIPRLTILTLAGVLITLIGGAVYGRLSHRWGPTPNLQAAADRLMAMPKQLGEWECIAEEPISEFVQENLKSGGYINRVYRKETTGEHVNVFIVVGPPGPIAVHTPEVCYSSNNFPIQTQRSPITAIGKDQIEQVFWTLKFRTNNASAEELTVYYAWSDGQRWEASESPRYEFAGRPWLFKLQAAAATMPVNRTEKTRPGFEFIQVLVDSDWFPLGEEPS